MTHAIAPRQGATRRRGLSILEFVGCLSALIGGLLLGSFYLGVDVKEAAYTALEKAQIIDPVPKADAAEDESSKPAEPSEASTAPPTTTTPAGPKPATVQPPAADTGAVAETAPAETAPPAEPVVAPPPAGFFARPELITPEQRKTFTLAYWDALAVCMTEEIKNRTPAIDSDGNWQLFDYLTGRKDGHAKAAEAIQALDSRGVDDHVAAYAKKARAWHVDGAKLFGRAVGLLTDAPTAQLSGPFAQSWQSAATQHRMEERLLVEKYQAVEKYLSHAYGEAPPVAAED